MNNATSKQDIEVADVEIGGQYWSATVHAGGRVTVYCDGAHVGTAQWDPALRLPGQSWAGRLVGNLAISEEDDALDRAIAERLAA